MTVTVSAGVIHLICRIGSLEMSLQALDFGFELICRIGSLESEIIVVSNTLLLICRIGSLEKLLLWYEIAALSYLPHRQLRK